jgi:hypothetical protein
MLLDPFAFSERIDHNYAVCGIATTIDRNRAAERERTTRRAAAAARKTTVTTTADGARASSSRDHGTTSGARLTGKQAQNARGAVCAGRAVAVYCTVTADGATTHERSRRLRLR